MNTRTVSRQELEVWIPEAVGGRPSDAVREALVGMHLECALVFDESARWWRKAADKAWEEGNTDMAAISLDFANQREELAKVNRAAAANYKLKVKKDLNF